MAFVYLLMIYAILRSVEYSLNKGIRKFSYWIKHKNDVVVVVPDKKVKRKAKDVIDY